MSSNMRLIVWEILSAILICGYEMMILEVEKLE